LALLLKHMHEAPPPIAGLNPAVMAVVNQALAKAPQDRYAHAGDLAAELLSAIFGLSAPLRSAETPPLAGLLETLAQLQEQARIYERALPANNYTARVAMNALSKLAQQAANEAQDLSASLEQRSALKAAPHPFSPREVEVLALAARGLTNKEIAYRLGLSERTIQFHMNSVFNKSGTNSRTEAVATALHRGWLKT
jgi:DNA-binding CsgD family transcriptional regulator